MPSDLRDALRATLDEATPAALDRLFHSPDLLGWGRARTLRGFPLDADQTTWTEPVAVLGGVGVYRVDVPTLPTLTLRREHLRRVDGLHRGALLIYRTPDGGLAFSYARTREAGSAPEVRTLRYEPGLPARTTLDRLAGLRFTTQDLGLAGDPGPTVVGDRLHDAFSVEAVSDAFFREYRAAFERVRDAVSGLDADPDARHAFTQRLFNRLLFLRFLEAKRWLQFGPTGADRRYLLALWRDHARTGDDGAAFYDARLRPLFFAGLNNHRGGTAHDPAATDLRALVGRVPFLNGGLFDAAADGTDSAPGVSVPDDALASVLGSDDALLYRYHFTVTEATPLDAEVGVDPEMLGRVFEELVNDRHDSGSYYTPKEIVAFMGREALRHHLETRCPAEPPAALDAFVFDHDAAALREPEAILDALRRVRILDPACGSGAYLVGMLHELLDLRAALFATRHVDPATAFERKLDVIQTNLYGVDLKPFAVAIAQLRLWLSLVVDDPRNPLDDPDADVALPNLTYRIETGDSLTAPAPVLDGFGGLSQHAVDRHTRRLATLKAEHLRAHGPTKRGLETAIADEEDALRRVLALAPAPPGAFDWRVAFAEVFAPTAPAATLGGELALGQQLAAPPAPGGFDVVVANPPYVRMELFKDLKPVLRRHFTTHADRADLYVYFFERAHQLLRPGGTAAFIAPNKWLRAGYGEGLRRLLLDDHRMQLVVDFGELPVFQSAATFPAIYVWQKTPRAQHPTRLATVSSLEACYGEGVRLHVARIAHTLPATQFGTDKPRVVVPGAADRFERMAHGAVRLGEYVEGSILRGIVSGLNAAFVVDDATRERLVEADARSAEVLKPLLGGDDVRRYEIHDRGSYLIYAPRGFDIARYPAIEAHLRPFRDRLEARATRQPWYELQQPQSAYVPQLEAPKIVYPDIGQELRFTIDDTGFYGQNTVYFIARADWFLLGVLNSSSTFDFLKSVTAVLGDENAGGRLRFFGDSMQQLPIPTASDADRDAVAALARQAHALHAERRARVERLLTDLGTTPAASSIRSVLETPWAHPLDALRKKARTLPGHTDRRLADARDETAALTARIAPIESEIDARVAALYGL